MSEQTLLPLLSILSANSGTVKQIHHLSRGEWLYWREPPKYCPVAASLAYELFMNTDTVSRGAWLNWREPPKVLIKYCPVKVLNTTQQKGAK